MGTLKLSLLGSFEASLDETPLPGFRTLKTQALLIYLAAEPANHSRDSLMTLLWPGMPVHSARHNLRQVIYHLRGAIPEVSAISGASKSNVPLLLTNRLTIQLNPEADVELDIAESVKLLEGTQRHNHLDLLSCHDCTRDMEAVIDLYRGDFLVDFYLDDSNEFEEWSQIKREAYRRGVLDALETLTTINTRQKSYAEARVLTERQLEIDNLRESAYRQLMEVMALSGQRSEALALYETCRRIMAEELGMAPAARTTQVYEKILAGDLRFDAPMTQGVRGYELKDEIGEGAYGSIHRAIQPAIGREVAVKIIRRKYANNPEFIRRFEAEAQTIARLEHPYIVPLYDYWRDPEGAYLIMRYMRGGSLLASLETGQWDLEPAMKMLDQVASALSVAHRHGVIHRDIKPANILLDDDGNSYLSDFGIAKDLTGDLQMTVEGAIIGTPDYISPEQIKNEQVSSRTDIYSLGAVLYEMLTGEKPFPDTSVANLIYKQLHDPVPLVSASRPDLPSQIDAVIQRATAKSPVDRYADALEMAEAFRRAARGLDLAQPDTGTVMVPAGADILNPYKGLRPFQESDADDFYGRETLVSQLIARLAQNGNGQFPGGQVGRFLAVVGPSGSGKSSAVKAGLIPALRQGAILGSENWFIAEMVPGTHPLEELELALWPIAVDPPPSLVEPMSKDERGMLRTIRRVLPEEEGAQLLLIIDQFEELFTVVDDDDRRTFFIDSLLAAINAPRSPLTVVITLRADFYDRPLQYQPLAEWMRSNTELVLPLNSEQLTWAIREPARRVGVGMEQGLAEEIVSEVLDQPGALPLVQYTMTELFERRQDNILVRPAYEEIGGVLGALGGRAEEIYANLGRQDRELSRQLFLRLVTLGEGVEDTRRRVLRSELEALTTNNRTQNVNENGLGVALPESLVAAGSQAMSAIIDAFGSARLLTFDHEPITREPTVEVAHEALLREWGRLRGWLAESRDDIRNQRQVTRAALEWEEADRDNSFLIPGGARLEQFITWRDISGVAFTQNEEDFLKASVIADTEQKDREAKHTRTRRNLRRGLVGALIVGLIVAIGLSIFAFRQRQEALRQASIGLAALAERELGGIDRELSVLLALEAVEQYPITSQAAGALALSVEEFRPFRILGSSESVADLIMVATWSPDGSRIAGSSSQSPNSVVIWDAPTGSDLLSVNTHGDLCREDYNLMHDLAWSSSGGRLAVTAQDPDSGEGCGVVVLDTASGETLLILARDESAARSLDWSPDETVLLTGHEDGVARLYDAYSGTERSTLTGHTGVVHDAVFSPDGNRIATASEDGTIRLWNAETGAEQMVFSGHAGAVRSVAWSPNGMRLVTGGNDGLPRVWDVESGKTLFVLPGHIEDVVIVTWSADGRRIASQSLDATVKVWDAATGGLLFQIPNAAPDPATKRGFVEFSPDGRWILAGASRVLGLRIWDASTSVPKLFGHTFGQEWGGWSPDGTLIATSGEDGSARLWDAATGQQLKAFDQGSFWGAWSPDGTRLAFADGIGAHTVTVWDVETGGLLVTLSAPDDEYGSHQFLTMNWSPDSAYIAAADFRPGTPQPIYVWDTETAELIMSFQTDDTCHLGWPRWSPDGSRIATGCIFVESGINTHVRIWDLANLEELKTLESEYGWTYRAVWSPDGARLLAAYENGAAQIWDVATGKPIITFTGHQGPVDGEWSPDGTLIASTDFSEQVVKIWDSETGEELFSFSVAGAPLTIGWSPDGTQVIVTGDGLNEPIIKRVWRSIDELVEYAYDCCVSRELTLEERVEFGLPERP